MPVRFTMRVTPHRGLRVPAARWSRVVFPLPPASASRGASRPPGFTATAGVVLRSALLALLAAPHPAAADSIIDPAHAYTWSENAGWWNWSADADPTNPNPANPDPPRVYPTHFEGRIWAEGIGWVSPSSGASAGAGAGPGPHANTDGENFGVNILSSGALDGYAYGESAGWMLFGTHPYLGALGLHARLDGDRLRGFAWGEAIGWINLDDDEHYVALRCPDFCEDGDPCTTDTCLPGPGCVHAPNPAACDDGIACTTDSCVTGAGCVHTPNPAACDDADPCTTDLCLPTGCTHTPHTGACDDANACTGNDSCVEGICVGAPLSCDDGLACTWDLCEPAAGCFSVNVEADAEPCNGIDDDCDGVVDEACAWLVDAASTAPLPDGRSWQTAFPTVQQACAVAASGDEIWLRHGLYTAASPSAPVAIVPSGVAVRGGFAGVEIAPSQRPPGGPPSVLSGDRDGSLGPTAGDSLHVVQLASGVTLDRLHVVRGAALGSSSGAQGGGVYGVNATQVVLRDCTIADNRGILGAGVRLLGSSGGAFSLWLEGCSLLRNAASLHGGAVDVESQGSLVVQDCLFADNDGGSYGGAIAAAIDGSVQVSRSDFQSNGASSSPNSIGGAIWIDHAGAELVVSDCAFTGNTANASGGALWSRKAALSVSRTEFYANDAGASAGAAYSQQAPASFTDCRFEQNTAGGDAGALLVSSDAVTLTRCEFVGNAADDSGGAGHLLGDVDEASTIRDCAFVGNQAAVAGGALVLGPGAFSLRDVRIESNESGLGGGGGIVSYGAQGEASGLLVRANSTTGSGGGLRLTGADDLELRRLQVVGNTSGDDGGGLSISTCGQVRLIDALVADNQAADRGGALHVVNADVPVDLASLADNQAPVGSTIYTSNAGAKHTRVRHTAVHAGPSAGPLFAGSGANKTPLLTYCCVQGGAEGEGNVTLPAAPSPWSVMLNGEWRLVPTTGAACIDAGSDALAAQVAAYNGIDWAALTTTPDDALDSPPIDAAKHYLPAPCLLQSDGTPCDDGDPCTSGDACVAGACSGGASPCDDGSECTIDVCGPDGECLAIAAPGACDDGSQCTWGEQCEAGACGGGWQLACDDGEPCTADACDPATGCTHDPTGCTCVGSGDANADGQITVVDVQCVILLALSTLAGDPSPPPCAADPIAADANCDGVVAVADVQLVILKTLQSPLSVELDADGDGCVDACQAP